MRARSRLRLRSPFIPVVVRPRQSRRGFSLVFFGVFGLIALTAFVTLGVDIGRLRLARTQLQNAADGAALASASSLQYLPQPDGVTKVQDIAIDTAAENTSLDQAGAGGGREDTAVRLVRDEDIQFGIWRPMTGGSPADFFPLEYSGGKTDERREANAVRVWARRCTTYVDDSGATVVRNTGVPLIFGPVIGMFRGEANMHATVRLMGGRPGYGFIGLDSVSMNGTTNTDSYSAATEIYPGADGAPNKLGSVASNGNINLVGNATVWGDAHPGVQGSITPYPLDGNVVVTGYMNPLDQPMVYAAEPFSPQTSLPNTTFTGKGKNGGSINAGDYLFSSWSTGSHDAVTIKNAAGPVRIWVNGNFTSGAQATITLESPLNPVTIWVNGNVKMDGGPVTNPGLPANLTINVTKSGTSVDLGGNGQLRAHVYAPLSDVKVHGTPGYFGSIVGKTLTVDGTSQLHYDETFVPDAVKYSTHMVE